MLPSSSSLTRPELTTPFRNAMSLGNGGHKEHCWNERWVKTVSHSAPHQRPKVQLAHFGPMAWQVALDRCKSKLSADPASRIHSRPLKSRFVIRVYKTLCLYMVPSAEYFFGAPTGALYEYCLWLKRCPVVAKISRCSNRLSTNTCGLF